ncbi:hypothetical protein BDU57DRAFT_577453 [Ampelomyces quisqualis]|uniref:Uncharacterized protein n=1 Tax=Ampelomyces quisqualis TaxID=50730 RepID=A0A6A5QLV2_AMPQU|nr:hypothetical protein BDU57DRAFT_577453 [Ampelomyces quisqualis]
MADNCTGEDAGTSRHHVENSFESIKTLVAPFREIINVTLEESLLARISRITRSTGSSHSACPGLPIYTIHTDPVDGCEVQEVKGIEAFPPEISSQLRSAVLKLNTCDMTVNAFLSRLSDALLSVGARTDWLLVCAEPLFGLHYDVRNLEMPVHSVFCITTASGEEFIADFSVEQFGYDETHWFMDKYQYLVECTKNGIYRIPSNEEIAEAVEGQAQNQIAAQMIDIFRLVHDELDWSELVEVPADEQVPWVRSRIRQMLQRWKYGVENAE